MNSQPRVPRGARNLVVAQLVKAVVMLLGIVVLSRVLDAADFGAVAVAIAIVGIGELLRDLGLSTAATTAPHFSRELRDLLFWINVGIAIVFAAFVALLSPVAGSIFDNNVLTASLPWLSLVFIFNGFGAQYRADLNRSMRFNSMAVVDSIGALAGVLAAICLAIVGAGYWSLIAQPIVMAGVSAVLLASLGGWLPRRPRWTPDAKSVIGFGFSVSWSQVLMYAGNNVDTFALGYFGTAAQLGYYSRSFQVAIQPLTLLKAPATAVALPLLSRRRDDPASYSRAASYGLKMIAYTVVPAALAISACASPVVAIFLGPGWDATVSIIAVLAVAAAIQQYAAVASWMFLSANRGKALRRYSGVSLIVKVATVLLAAPYGPLMVAAAFLASAVISAPIALVWACKESGVRIKSLLTASLIPVTLSIIASGVAAVTCAFIPFGPLAQLAVSIVAFLSVYAIGLVMPSVRSDIKMVVRTMFNRGR